MNLIQAINSHLPFKRKGSHFIFMVDGQGAIRNYDESHPQGHGNFFKITDVAFILAEDWELVYPSITITESKLREAFSKVADITTVSGREKSLSKPFVELLVEELFHVP